ncbi:MAG: hypothetical protein OEM49_04100 [Myxococcales bacterium]|nr:hypothetical protein [Myxococcales bacterium]MDH5305601.1 hypothetical protein [Myxococcales bacterium]MDH5565247.1 hypothetical protein [Myxococcales bacterium]
MRIAARAMFVALALALASSAGADVLKTRDGRSVEGTFRGATQQEIQFEVGGALQIFRIAEVSAIGFSAPSAAATPLAPAAPASAGPAEARAPSPASAAPALDAPRAATVPAGTRLRARLSDSLDPRRSAAGDRFAALLEAPIVVEGVAIAPANTPVYGRVAEVSASGAGAGRLDLELTEIMLQGQMLKILTSTHQTAEPAGAGAPASAAVAGTPAAPESGERITAGSLLEFRLLKPFDVRVR